MKKLLVQFLQRRARVTVEHFQPKIIAITGSIGKTSTRRAVECVVMDHFDARASKKNFNNEIGVPLAIFGQEESPGSSPLKWFKLLWSTYNIRSFPELLVLEYGVDSPGDMDGLLAITRPAIAIFTGVSEVHAANYPDGVLGIQREKAKLVEGLKPNGVSILNVDDDLVVRTASPEDAQLVTYGFGKSDVQAREIKLDAEDGDVRQCAHVYINGKVVGELALKQLGDGAVYASLAALAVGEALELDPMASVRSLNRQFVAEPGRLALLKGKGGLQILDDTYNAAPASIRNGLELLRDLKQSGAVKGSILVALGNMGELGIYSKDAHEEVGELVAQVADGFIAVGDQMQLAAQSAVDAGMPSHAVYSFSDSHGAAAAVNDLIDDYDVFYAKGSQSQRMERVVKAVLDPSEDADQLLVRQSKKWLST